VVRLRLFEGSKEVGGGFGQISILQGFLLNGMERASRCQLRCIFTAQYIQHDRVREQLYIVRVFLQSSLQRDFRFWQSTQVHFSNGLADDRDW